MSIIQDALRKAGRDRSLKIQVPADRRASRFNWGPVFILLILLVITGPIVLPLFSTPYRNNNEGTSLTEMASADLPSAATGASRSAQFGIEAMPILPSSAAGMGNLDLSGIVYSKDASYCILNGQILKPGESLQGIKLEQISEDSVTLSMNGETFVVSSR